MGFIADFKETADGVYTLNHSAIAGCNLCLFRRYNGNARNISLFAYCLKINYHNAASRTSVKRHEAIRNLESMICNVSS